MVKCKVCKQKAELLYWLVSGKMCVMCHVKIDNVKNPIELTEEWRKKNKVSEEAVKKYLKKKDG